MIDTTMATHWALLALMKYWWPSQSLAIHCVGGQFWASFSPVTKADLARNHLMKYKRWLDKIIYKMKYLSYDVCACFRPCVRLSEWVSFCKKKIFVQNGWNLQIRWTDISNSRIQARRAWSLVLYKGQILLISVFKSSLISYVPLFL